MSARIPDVPLEANALKHAVQRARLGVWDWDLRTDTCAYSDGWFEMLGYRPDELPPASDLWIRLTHPEDRERAILSGEKHLAGDAAEIETEIRLRHKDGRWIWVLDRGGIIERDPQGRPLRVVGVQTDITRQKLTEEQLVEVNQRFELALEASDIGIWQFDKDTGISFWDQRTRAIFGLPPDSGDLVPGIWHQYLHPEDKQAAEEAHEQTTGETRNIRYRIVRADGEVRHVETLTRLVPVLGTSGRLTGTIRDVTEEVERQRELAWAASHDALTGLLNRSAFEEILAEHVANADEAPFSLLFIDLDYFKAINDSAGHAAGDVTLKAISAGLKDVAGRATVARLGGDEFVVMLRADDGDPIVVSEAILDLIRDVTRSLSHKTATGASIGIAGITSPAIGPADAMSRADDACYAAKQAGRNQWSVFEVDRPFSSGLTAAQLVADLADAKLDGRLRLFGQEIRRLADPMGEAVRVEVLARLYSRDGDMILPTELISAAERFGVAAALDRWIIRAALLEFGARLGPVILGLNLSAHTLSDASLWDFVERTRAEAGVPSSQICFEITETAAFTDASSAETFVRRARAEGYRIALDDFGAGLSTFSYLRQFPVDTIKIDGSFIERIAESALDKESVRSMCRVAAVLGCDLVAEKIERQDSLEVLRDLGVHYGQGFLMHRPEPLPDLLARIVPRGASALSR